MKSLFSLPLPSLMTGMKTLIRKQKQVALFILAGGLSAIVEVGFFKLLSVLLVSVFPQEVNLWGIHYPLSNILSTGCAIIFNYYLSIWFVFQRGKYSKRREFAYFMGVSVFSTLLSLVFFQLFFQLVYHSYLNIIVFVLSREVLSKISAITVVSVLNYFVKKRMVFSG